MAPPLWAPWRMEYVVSPKLGGGCIFCGVAGASADDRASRLVVATTPRGFVMLNRYPFAAGHLLVVPHAHVSALDELEPADADALFRLVSASVQRLRSAVRAEGFNVGLNLGAAAGASIAEHLHVQVVPRWANDTNFMPVIADTRVVPQALEATRAHLAPHFQDLSAGSEKAASS